MANQFNNIEFDEIDVAMSQLDTNVFVVGENGFTAENEMDEIMSQIDLESLYEPEKKVDTDEAADEMDDIMSQIDMASLYGEEESADTDEGVPQELQDLYENIMDGIEDDLILQMEQEEDPEVEAELPLELLQEYEKAMNSILPKKSTDRYMQAYKVFRNWQKSHRTNSFDEKIIMAYLSEASAKYKPTTLWSMYSMLKKTLLVKHNVDLKTYCRLRAFLKNNSDGYQSKKSLVFTPEDLKNFIVDAPDVSYLTSKVILILGVVGVCRGDELTNLTIGNVNDDGKEITVYIPMTKTKEPKVYIICGEMAKIIREYLKLRPNNAKTDRLLMQHRKGKCVNQVIGKHSIAKIPKQIATFLKLPEPNLYTGHSYRRTGTTIAADSGASMEQLMRLGPWKSITVCQRYIQESKTNKRKLSNLIGSAINLPSTSQGITNNIVKRFAAESSSGQPVLDESVTTNDMKGVQSDENVSDCDVPNLSGASNSECGEIASGAVKLNSGAVKSLSETLKGLGVDPRRDKQNVIFQFGAECKSFTIVNL